MWKNEGIILARKTEVLGENPFLAPFCAPQISRGLAWDRNWADNLKAKINVNSVHKSSPYRAVNTLRLAYENELVNVV